jgi:hypothetical protein
VTVLREQRQSSRALEPGIDSFPCLRRGSDLAGIQADLGQRRREVADGYGVVAGDREDVLDLGSRAERSGVKLGDQRRPFGRDEVRVADLPDGERGRPHGLQRSAAQDGVGRVGRRCHCGVGQVRVGFKSDISPFRSIIVSVSNATSDLDLVAYASAATAPLAGDALGDLLLKARSNNARANLTGMLVYHDDSFFQVLEGPPAAVEDAYLRISEDPRHCKIIKLIQEPVEERSFADWTMGLGSAERSDLIAIPGLNDFFSQGSCLWELEPSRARTLLEAFREGRWRRTIHD